MSASIEKEFTGFIEYGFLELIDEIYQQYSFFLTDQIYTESSRKAKELGISLSFNELIKPIEKISEKKLEKEKEKYQKIVAEITVNMNTTFKFSHFFHDKTKNLLKFNVKSNQLIEQKYFDFLDEMYGLYSIKLTENIQKEAQKPRSPEAQKPRSPKAQKPRSPEAQKPRSPEAQKPRSPSKI